MVTLNSNTHHVFKIKNKKFSQQENFIYPLTTLQIKGTCSISHNKNIFLDH